MATAVQLVVAALWTLLASAVRARSETSGSQPSAPPPSASNSSGGEPVPPRVQEAREETHMVAAGPGAPAASHSLLTLTLVLVLCSVSVAAAFGLRRVFRRVFFRDRLGSYRYFKVNQDDDGELMAVDGGDYHVALDDSSEDELGPARLPVNTPETAQARRSTLSPPPEAKSLLIESSDEELLQ